MTIVDELYERIHDEGFLAHLEVVFPFTSTKPSTSRTRHGSGGKSTFTGMSTDGIPRSSAFG